MNESLVRRDVFWGVDWSTLAASIGWVVADGSSRGVVTAIWENNLHGGARLAAAGDSIRDLARVLALDHPAVFTYVEQPSGRARGLELVYMCGVVQASIYRALHAHWHQPVEVRTVPSGTWKKSVLGRGDYGKPGPDDNFEYEAIKWVRRHGADVEDDNEADALCIAEHARLAVVFA